jgi:hypothetical protein
MTWKLLTSRINACTFDVIQHFQMVVCESPLRPPLESRRSQVTLLEVILAVRLVKFNCSKNFVDVSREVA